MNLLALLLPLLLAPTQVDAREPVPFTDAYLDGYVWVVWGEHRTDAELNSILARIRQSGAKHLSVPIWGCQSTLTSSDVGSCQVASQAYALHRARLARQAGFEVSLLPILVTARWEWRGFFEPLDVDAWFRSYEIWITELARVSQAEGMKEFVAGSEMTGLYRHGDRWKELLRRLRTVYSGPIVMTVNWGDHRQSYWEEADAIGISAYYPLSQAATPTQAELDRSWSRLKTDLVNYARQQRRPLHLTEVGYGSAANAAREPWNPAGPNADSALQQRCFEAFSRAWAGEREMVRVGIWATEDPIGVHNPFGFEPIGKPAETTLNAFFNSRLSLPRLSFQ